MIVLMMMLMMAKANELRVCVCAYVFETFILKLSPRTEDNHNFSSLVFPCAPLSLSAVPLFISPSPIPLFI